MTPEQMIDAIRDKLLAWLKPIPGVPAEETLLQIVEIYEANGMDLIKADWPAND